jgi:hypothetical protein
MARAVAAGEIRSDVTPKDLIRALVGMFYMREQTGWQDAVRSALRFLRGRHAKP